MKIFFITFAMFFSLINIAQAKDDPMFTLRNKSNNDVYVVVGPEIEGITIQGHVQCKLAHLGKLLEAKQYSTGYNIILYKDMFCKVPIYKAKLMNGKNAYLNWDGKKLYPQKGPYLGITGKTDEGYSLKENITNIKVLEISDKDK